VTWRETLRVALRGVRRRPLRNGLAVVGVAIATATLVALLALSNAARRDVLSGLEQRPMLTSIQVVPAAPRAGVASRPLDAQAVTQIAAVPGVTEVLPVVVVPATLRAGASSPSGTVSGITPSGVAPYSLAAGRAPYRDEANAIVLTTAGLRAFGGAADAAVGMNAQLELRRGTSVVERKTVDVRVTGVAANEIPGLVIVPLALAEDALSWIATGESSAARDLRLAQQAAAALLFGGSVLGGDLAGSRYASLWVVTRSIEDVRPAKGSIEALGYGAFSEDAAVAAVEDLFRAVDALLVAVAVAAFVLAGLGIVNALVSTVSERTVEIGVLKALGATEGTVARIVVTEAAVLGSAGGLVGVGLGWASAYAAAIAGRAASGSTSVALSPQPDLAVAVIAFATATFLALFAAWLPARRAARLVPAEALRAE
jgi:putative ABC transport system permease protein